MSLFDVVTCCCCCYFVLLLGVVSQVLEVEEEMRSLLRETDSSRRLMDEKVKKLSKAFIELHSDVC